MKSEEEEKKEIESQLTQEELTEKIEEIVFAKEDKFDELKDEYEDQLEEFKKSQQQKFVG